MAENQGTNAHESNMDTVNRGGSENMRETKHNRGESAVARGKGVAHTHLSANWNMLGFSNELRDGELKTIKLAEK